MTSFKPSSGTHGEVCTHQETGIVQVALTQDEVCGPTACPTNSGSFVMTSDITGP